MKKELFNKWQQKKKIYVTQYKWGISLKPRGLRSKSCDESHNNCNRQHTMKRCTFNQMNYPIIYGWFWLSFYLTPFLLVEIITNMATYRKNVAFWVSKGEFCYLVAVGLWRFNITKISWFTLKISRLVTT